MSTTAVIAGPATALPDATHFSAGQRWSFILALTLATLLIHGYHPFSEDAAIYVPAIKKQLDHSLYPHAAQFFLLPARFSIFSKALALSIRVTHIPFACGLLLWYLLVSGLLLLACWRICKLCFGNETASLYGTSLVAAILTVPVAGCSLLLADPYLTSRSLSTPILLFAICDVLEDKIPRAFLWFVLAALIHPLMAVYGGAFLVTLFAVRKRAWWLLGLSGISIAAVALYMLQHAPVSSSYRAAVLTRSYFFLSQWAWYEIFGIIAPLCLFAWLLWSQKEHSRSRLGTCAIAVLCSGSFFFLLALLVTRDTTQIGFARYQPMRSFHLIYLLLFLLPVNMFMQKLTGRRPLVCAIILVPVCAMMFAVQRQTFPSSPHIEWPWLQSEGAWQQAFNWIRSNTPKDAVFALDPDYMDQEGEDRRGFRAFAERSSLADRAKDGGVAAVFPELASSWIKEVNAATGFGNINNEAQALPLAREGVTWIVTYRRASMSLNCPYQNDLLTVCQIHSPAGGASAHSPAAQQPGSQPSHVLRLKQPSGGF